MSGFPGPLRPPLAYSSASSHDSFVPGLAAASKRNRRPAMQNLYLTSRDRGEPGSSVGARDGALVRVEHARRTPVRAQPHELARREAKFTTRVPGRLVLGEQERLGEENTARC